MFEALVRQWGYVAVALGVLAEGEGTLLAAGAMAHKGLLLLRWVWVAAFVGTVAADQLWFWVGRRFGAGFLARRPRLARRSEQVQRWVERYGAAFVASVRFFYGLRAASVAWLGASGYSYRRFAVLDTVGAVVWSLTLAGAGWGLGATVRALLGRTGHLWELVAGAVALAAAAWGVARWVRRRR